ncbi:MAG TPA: dihydrolipoyl dehydrogenase [Candidatus Avibacteroides faecavium]|nr:dihydrolipoyl dehydrogenase [Candidatus Avibacteroides faecavium]
MNYDLAIIGGGPAGYTAAEKAGKAGLKTVIFEKNNLGGVCLNEGCIPTKTLLYSAKTYSNALHAGKYGVAASDVSADIAKIAARKGKVVRKLVLGIKSKLPAAGVEIVAGEARIVDKNTVECNGQTYTCARMIVCTGSATFIPPIDGIGTVPYWTHRDALDCKALPQSLAIVGGGVIGMEFAAYFSTLGTKVTVIEMMDEIIGTMDSEIAAALRAEYAKRGVTFLLQTRVTAVRNGDEGITVDYETADGAGSVTAEKLLMSVGRRPVTTGFGLENLGLATDDRRRIAVDKHMMSSVEGVYVCGDLNGNSLLAHTAVREAEVAVNHILNLDDEMSYAAIPGVVYTNPEVASVGMTAAQAAAAGIECREAKLPMAFSGRFVAENEGVNGICKVVIGNDGKILGAHVLGNPASEIITLAGIAITMGLTAEQWARTVFPHPTVGEIFKEAVS